MPSGLESKQKTNSLLPFLCSSCPKSFKAKNHLQKHSKRHSEQVLEPRFPCSQCAKLFRTKELTLAHEKNVHGEKKLKCSQCERLFSSKKDFHKHDCNHKSRKVEYCCDQCDHKTVNKEKLNTHMRSIHNKNYKSYFCNICSTEFVRRYVLKLHMKKFHPIETINQLSNLELFDIDIIGKLKECKDSLPQNKDNNKNDSNTFTEENRYLIIIEGDLEKKKQEKDDIDTDTTDIEKHIKKDNSNMYDSFSTQETKNVLGYENLWKPLTETKIENNVEENDGITAEEPENYTKHFTDMSNCDLKYNDSYKEKESDGSLNKMENCEDIEDIDVKLKEQEEWIKDVDLHKISITMSERQRYGLGDEKDYEKDDIKSEDGLPLTDPCLEPSKPHLNDNSVAAITLTPDIKIEDINKETLTTYRQKEMKTLGQAEKIYRCLECEKVFLYKPSLKVHQRLHTGEKPYQCDLCEKSFSRISSYNIHKTTHSDERPYQCDICGKGSKIKQSYANHMRLHEGDERYKCNECEKQCTTKQKFEIHKRLHSTAEKKYICDICGKYFSQPSHLKVHVRLHTDKKHYVKTPYRCTVCDKFFKKERGLMIHNAMQHSARLAGQPLTCLECGKQFQKQNHLQKHNRRHALAASGSIFPCSSCSKQFMSMELVKMHHKNVHAEKTLECINCLKRFSANRELRRHICKTHLK